MASSDPFEQVFEDAKRAFLKDLAKSKPDLQREILANTSINQVYDAVDKLQAEQANHGRMRNLAKISPYLDAVKSYAGVVEQFVQIKPEIMALIWGPIKFLLLWADNLKSGFDAVLDTTAKIGGLLPQFERVREVFGGDDRIKSILGLFYRDILDFHAAALHLFSKPRKLDGPPYPDVGRKY